MGVTKAAGLRQVIPVLALAFPGCLLAGANVWTAAEVPGASGVRVQFDPQDADRMLALAPSGLYRSVDAGVTWQLLNGDLTTPLVSLAVNPDDGTKVVIGAGQELYASVTGGALPWRRQGMTGERKVTELAYSRDGSAVYAIRGADAYRSTDTGLTWVQRGALPSNNFLFLAPGPAASGALYVAQMGVGVFVSTDGAATWQQFTSQPANLTFTGIDVGSTIPARLAVSTFNGLYISNDGGSSWVMAMGGDFRSVASDPSRPDTLYAVDGAGKVIRSTNGGGTWSVLGAITALDDPRIAIAPSRSSRLAASQGTTIWFSDDGGQTWEQRAQGLNAAHVTSISNGSERSYVGLSGSDIATIDSGSSVSHRIDSGALKATGQLGFVTVTAVPGNPDVLLALNERGLVVRSANAGGTWATVPDLPSSLFIRQIVVSRTEPRVLYAVTATGIMKSTDRGTSWRPGNLGLPAAGQPQYVAAGPGDKVYLAVAEQISPPLYRLYASADAAEHWEPVGSAQTSAVLGLSAHPVDPLTVFWQTHVPSDLLRSRDGGQTWTSTNICCVYGGVLFDPRDARTAYAGGSGLIYRSVDGGDTWRTVSPNPLLMNWSYGDAFALDPKDPDTLLLSGGYGFGLQQLRITPDLVLTATGHTPMPAVPNSPVTASFTLRNAGPFDATRVRLVIQLPGSAAGIAVSAPGASCMAGTSSSCTFDTLRDGASVNIAVTATSAAAGDFVLSASVVADQPELVPGNNTATATIPVSAAMKPPQEDAGGGGGGMSWPLLALFALMLGNSVAATRLRTPLVREAGRGYSTELPSALRNSL